MFLKVANENATTFSPDEKDVSYITSNQVQEVLEAPLFTTKCNRIFYEFKKSIDVFEM